MLDQATITRMVDALRLVDADIRHHLRGAYGRAQPAMIRSHAVMAVIDAMHVYDKDQNKA